MAVFEDLQQVAPLGVLERGQAPVVDDQKVGASEFLQGPTVGAVDPGDGEVMVEARGADVVGRQARSAGPIGEGACQVGLPNPGFAGYQKICGGPG